MKSIKPPFAQDPSDPRSLFPLLGIILSSWVDFQVLKVQMWKSQLISSCVFFLKNLG